MRDTSRSLRARRGALVAVLVGLLASAPGTAPAASGALGDDHEVVVVPAGSRGAGPDTPTTAAAAGEVAAAIAATPDGNGFWIATAGGRVEAHGTAAALGDMSGAPLNAPIVSMVSSATGAGYWMVAADGGVFAFGDAPFHGSTGDLRLNRPVVSMAPTPTGAGYWMVATDGGIFAFGDAAFAGSMGGTPLNQPVNGITVSPTGRGYRMVAADGGIFLFGDAPFLGSLGGLPMVDPVVGMATTPAGDGYWMVTDAGSVFRFGTAAPFGDAGSRVVGVAANRVRQGLRVLHLDGSTQALGAGVGGTAPTPPFDGAGPTPQPPSPPTTGPHAFSFVGPDGAPARWDPCAGPLRFVVDWRALAPSRRGLLAQVLDRVTEATGIEFASRGERSTTGELTVPPQGVDLAFVFPPAGGDYGLGQRAGVTRSAITGSGGDIEIIGAVIAVDERLAAPALREVLLHELGHAVGLDHVGAIDQVMWPAVHPAPLQAYGEGDREGLWRVGAAQGCVDR